MIYLRSIIFNILFFLWCGTYCLSVIWTLILPRSVLHFTLKKIYVPGIAFLERNIIGLRSEVTGLENLPRDTNYIIASKHQSLWETNLFFNILAAPIFIIKRELSLIPIWGWYALKIGFIAVNRGNGRKAIQQIKDGIDKIREKNQPIIIFPQGTRVKPRHSAPYKIGIGLIYEKMNLPVVPIALNSGLFWGKGEFIIQPGTIKVAILPPIMPGKPIREFMQELETVIETKTTELENEEIKFRETQ